MKKKKDSLQDGFLHFLFPLGDFKAAEEKKKKLQSALTDQKYRSHVLLISSAIASGTKPAQKMNLKFQITTCLFGP